MKIEKKSSQKREQENKNNLNNIQMIKKTENKSNLKDYISKISQILSMSEHIALDIVLKETYLNHKHRQRISRRPLGFLYLSLKYNVNKNTMCRAFNNLVKRGLVERRAFGKQTYQYGFSKDFLTLFKEFPNPERELEKFDRKCSLKETLTMFKKECVTPNKNVTHNVKKDQPYKEPNVKKHPNKDPNLKNKTLKDKEPNVKK